jgi:predicted lipase
MKESKPVHRFVAAIAMLGGAMAILCAAAQEHRSAGVYVYGCPRMGDGAFRKTFEGLRVYRVENNNDSFVSHFMLHAKKKPQSVANASPNGCP